MIVTTVFLVALELSTSSFIFLRSWIGGTTSENFWMFEATESRISFDPASGYRLPREPVPWARIAEGRIEYRGEIKGNNFGFPDRDDFVPRKSVPNRRRYVVFGDSFTGGQYIDVNWPQRVEMSTPRPIELLNFSLPGIGLANWYSMFTAIVDPEFEYDGLVFAVFDDDLSRPFFVLDQREGIHPQQGYSSMDPEKFPKTLSDARRYFRVTDVTRSTWLLERDKFESALRRGRIETGEPARFELFFWTRLVRVFKDSSHALRARARLRELLGRATEPETGPTLTAAQLRLVEGVRASTQIKDKDVVVIRIPSREAAMRGSQIPSSTTEFARLLSARLFDGGKAFEGIREDQIARLWFPHDGHWNQEGSDVFARYFITSVLPHLARGDRPAQP